MTIKKRLVLLLCLILLAGGFLAVQHFMGHTQPVQTHVDTSSFVVGQSSFVSYDATAKQVSVTGTITNKTGVAHQVDILVVVRDQDTGKVITNFTEAFPLTESSDPTSFTFTHACPTAFTNADAEISVAGVD